MVKSFELKAAKTPFILISNQFSGTCIVRLAGEFSLFPGLKSLKSKHEIAFKGESWGLIPLKGHNHLKGVMQEVPTQLACFCPSGYFVAVGIC